MTKAEAGTLRVKWKLRADLLACEHPAQELEANDKGYLTGDYQCT